MHLLYICISMLLPFFLSCYVVGSCAGVAFQTPKDQHVGKTTCLCNGKRLSFEAIISCVGLRRKITEEFFGLEFDKSD